MFAVDGGPTQHTYPDEDASLLTDDQSGLMMDHGNPKKYISDMDDSNDEEARFFSSSDDDDDDDDDDEDDDDDSDETSSDDDDDEEEDELVGGLPEGTTSYLIVAPMCSTPFWTAVTVYALEMILFSMLLANLVGGNPGNPLGFPPSFSAPVIFAQFFALLIAVTTQDDVVSGLTMLYEGYHDELVEAFSDEDDPKEESPVTLAKWCLALGFLMSAGILGLVTTFILIVTSPDVVSLLLNFTAVEFISLLDNGAFFLSQQGFLGQVNKEQADEIAETKYELPHRPNRRHSLQMLLLFISYILMLAGWSIIFVQQEQGRFTPSSLTVQFDDELGLELGTYSGVYQLSIRRRAFGFGRIRYANDVGTFGYCQADQVWTFTPVAQNGGNLNNFCNNYIARSDSSSSFDITTTNQNPWFIQDPSNLQRFFPMQNFQLSQSCNTDLDCGGMGHGVCTNDKCECLPRYYGWRCDFDREKTCATVEADTVLASPFTGNQKFQARFDLLQTPPTGPTAGDLLRIFDHPVYYAPLTAGAAANIILFTGIRWALFPLPFSVGIFNLTSAAAVSTYLSSKGFDPITLFRDSREFFVSDQVAFNTPMDVATPVGVAWNLVQVSQSQNAAQKQQVQSADSVLICAICNNQTNPCSNNNTCPADGFCNCTNGATGTLCRITPTQNGFCNQGFFNEAKFTYDGGDCCQYSCKNQPGNVCGYEPSTLVPGAFVHSLYPSCVDPAAGCIGGQSSNGLCWSENSQAHATTIAATFSRIVLSGNAKVLVQAIPSLDSVRVYDQLDSRWIQRGPDLFGLLGSMFGTRVALFTPPAIVTTGSSGPGSGVSAVLAVGLYRRAVAALQIFGWDSVAKQWITIGNEIELCPVACLLQEVTVGSQGNSVTVAAAINGTVVSVHKADLAGTSRWVQLSTLTGTHVTSSGDGNTVVVASSNQGSIQIGIYDTGTSSNSTSSSFQLLQSGSIVAPGQNATLESMKLSHDGLVLTVVSTSADLQDSVMSFYLNSTFPPIKFVPTQIGPLSRLAIASGFPPISVAEDGSSIAILVDMPNGPPVIQTYGYFFSLYGWTRVGVDYDNGLALDSPFSVSSIEAVSLVLATGIQQSITSVNLFPRQCPTMTSSYRLYMTLDSAPQNISYALQSYRIIDNRKVLTGSVNEVCDGCLTDTTNLAFTSLNIGGCIANEECLSLEVRDSSDTPASLYLFKNEAQVLQMRANSTNGSAIEITNSDNCQVPIPTCAQGESLFSLAITLDHDYEDTFWYVADEQGRIVAQRNSYSPSTSATVFEQVCLPNTVECYTFVLIDSGGDGLCCENGFGNYHLFFDGREIVTRQGNEFAFGERVQFGSCATVVTSSDITPVDAAVISIVADDHPEEISWHIEDSVGTHFGNSTGVNYVTGVSVTTNVYLFSEAIQGCLFFIIDDSGGNGFNAGGYVLSFNGVEVHRSNGNFRLAERVTFGGPPYCPTEVTHSSVVTAYVILDGRPTENEFYIGREDGTMVNGTVKPQAFEARTVSTVTYDPIADNNPSDCFTFTITDLAGDGLCCGAGIGSYELLLGWTRVATRSGEFKFGERARLGRGCPNNETEFIDGFSATVDVTLNYRPNETSWRLDDLNGNQLGGVTGDTYDDITGIYLSLGPNVAGINQINTVETFFRFPENETDECILFSIVDTAGDGLCCSNATSFTGNGSYALSVNGSEVFAGNGSFDFGERVQFGRNCSETVIEASTVEILIDFDSNPEQNGWFIGDGDGRIIESAPHIGIVGDQTAMIDAVFFASNNPLLDQSEGCLSFTIVDTAGNGICCTNGNGNYTVLLGWTEVARRNGTFGYGERLLFGPACPTPLQIIPGFAATLNLLGSTPGDTTWQIDNAIGEVLDGSNGGLYSAFTTNTTTTVQSTVFHFVDQFLPGDECLTFTIEDSVGNGLAGGNYNLTVNETIVYSSNGSFGFGERVLFGEPGGPCNVTVIPARRIFVSIQFDSEPQNISWYLGNSMGEAIPGYSGTGNASQAMSISEVLVYDPPASQTDLCFAFTIVNSAGMGVLGYSIVMGWKTVIEQQAGAFTFTERIRFGLTCSQSRTLLQPQVIPGYEVTVDMTWDYAPNETSWRLENANGTVLGGIDGSPTYDNWMLPFDPANAPIVVVPDTAISAPNVTSNVTGNVTGNVMGNVTGNDPLMGNVTGNATPVVVASDPLARIRTVNSVYHYPEGVGDECVYFSVVDLGFDGICCDSRVLQVVNTTTNSTVPVGGSYSLSINKQTVYTSEGTVFEYGERIQLGQTCPIARELLSLLTIVIALDESPNETSWELTNVNTGGAFVDGAPPGTYLTPLVNVSETVDLVGNTTYVFAIDDPTVNITVVDITTGNTNVTAGNMTASNMTASNMTMSNMTMGNMTMGNITMGNITASNNTLVNVPGAYQLIVNNGTTVIDGVYERNATATITIN